MPGWINVPVRIETRERLDKIKGSLLDNTSKSYDKIINELLNDFDLHKDKT